MERNTLFNIRSMTKPITGAAIQLLDRRREARARRPRVDLPAGIRHRRPQGRSPSSSCSRTRVVFRSRRSPRPASTRACASMANATGEGGPQFEPGQQVLVQRRRCRCARCHRRAGVGVDLGGLRDRAAAPAPRAWRTPTTPATLTTPGWAGSRACTSAARAIGTASGDPTTSRSIPTRGARRASTARRSTTRVSWRCGWTMACPMMLRPVGRSRGADAHADGEHGRARHGRTVSDTLPRPDGLSRADGRPARRRGPSGRGAASGRRADDHRLQRLGRHHRMGVARPRPDDPVLHAVPGRCDPDPARSGDRTSAPAPTGDVPPSRCRTSMPTTSAPTRQTSDRSGTSHSRSSGATASLVLDIPSQFIFVLERVGERSAGRSATNQGWRSRSHEMSADG